MEVCFENLKTHTISSSLLKCKLSVLRLQFQPPCHWQASCPTQANKSFYKLPQSRFFIAEIIRLIKIYSCHGVVYNANIYPRLRKISAFVYPSLIHRYLIICQDLVPERKKEKNYNHISDLIMCFPSSFIFFLISEYIQCIGLQGQGCSLSSSRFQAVPSSN